VKLSFVLHRLLRLQLHFVQLLSSCVMTEVAFDKRLSVISSATVLLAKMKGFSVALFLRFLLRLLLADPTSSYATTKVAFL
jgi:hypothetical protein